jgi:hypothetical protein
MPRKARIRDHASVSPSVEAGNLECGVGLRIVPQHFDCHQRQESVMLDCRCVRLVMLATVCSVVTATVATAKEPPKKFAAPRGFTPRYQEVRERFLKRFYFSGACADHVDVDHGKDVAIGFADQTCYLGDALVVFATEAWIDRQDDGQVNTFDSLAKIKELFDYFDKLDEAAEPRFHLGDGQSVQDGLFVRDDILGVHDTRFANRFLRVKSDFVSGKDIHDAKYWDCAPSLDQVVYLMVGCVAVKQLSGEAELAKKAEERSNRLFTALQKKKFWYHFRNQPSPTAVRGAEPYLMWPVLNELHYQTTGKREPSSGIVLDVGGDFKDLLATMCDPQSTKTECLRDFWEDDSYRVFVMYENARHIGEELWDKLIPAVAKPYIANREMLGLWGVAATDVWKQAELEKAIEATHFGPGEPISRLLPIPLLYTSVEHRNQRGKKIRVAPLSHKFQEECEAALAALPANGPLSKPGDDLHHNWFRARRWSQFRQIERDTERTERHYNGLDWMLLHNLMRTAEWGK